MQNYCKNDVILVQYPFSDLSATKVRPAVVVNTPHPSQDSLIVPLTSRTTSLLPGEFVLTDWQTAGLNVPTAVKRGINPRGGSTVTEAQFTHNRSTYDFTWSRILPWVLGNEILKDNRCVWAQLSTPLNGATANDAYQFLASVWAVNYTAWQSRFPSPLSAIRIF